MPTLNDLYSLATSSDPMSYLGNMIGNTQVGGGSVNAPMTAAPASQYQFNPGQAAAPVAQGGATGLGLQPPASAMPQALPQAPVAAPVQPMPQNQVAPGGIGLQPQMNQPAVPQMAQAQAQAPQAEPQLNALPSQQVGAMTKPAVPGAPVAQPAIYNPPPSAQPNPVAQQQAQTPNLYPSMLQVESGNQNYLPNGQPVTSNKGAMFAAQVMPATAKNPGYGITPAQSQTPEEYNRVGREFYNAMYKKFDSDPYKAAAAYNAGPGRVMQAEKEAREKGGDYRDYLPAETQSYLKKIQGMNHAEVSTNAIQTQKPTAEAGADMQRVIHTDYALTHQTNIPEMVRVAYADDTHPVAKQLAATIASENISHNENTRQAQTQGDDLIARANSGDQVASRQVANALAAPPKDEGSYLKAYLYHRFGMSQLAQQEQIKLGAGSTYQPVSLPDGTEAIVKMRADGQAMSGVDRTSNTPLTAQQLQDASGMYQKGAETGKSMYTDAQGHTISVTSIPGQTGLRYRDETTGQITHGAPAGLRPLSEQDPVTKHAIDTSTSVMNAMRKQNETQLGGNYFTEEEIQNAGAKAANAIYSQFGRTPPKSTVAQSAENMGGRLAIEQGQTNVPMVGAAGAAPQAAPQAQPQIKDQAYYEAHPEVRRPTDTPASFKARQTINPEGIEAEAKLIAEYGKELPKQGSSAYKQALNKRVMELNPEYDSKKFAQANDAIKKFTTGAEGKTVRAANVFIDHADNLRGAVDALNNGNIPLFNDIAQKYAKNTGQTAPTDFESMKRIVGDELVKAITGSGGALGDREEAAHSLSVANSPAQLKSVLDRYTQLMAGQVNGLRKEYEEAGLKDFDKKLLPRTQQELQKHSQQSNTRRSNW